MSDWIKVKDSLPKKTNSYLVIREVQANPTLAVFVNVTKKWMIMVGGQYWEIVGVQFWMDQPEHPTRKKDAEAGS
jgi:hypothetical protein